MVAHIPPGCWPAYLWASVGQARLPAWESFLVGLRTFCRVQAALKTGVYLTKFFRSSRLETRTKESKIRASAPVATRGA